jgi:hypothetical protein
MIDEVINSVIKDDTLGEDDDSCKKLSSFHSLESTEIVGSGERQLLQDWNDSFRNEVKFNA